LTAPNKSVPASLRALLENAVDYAGLYPPAALDLPTAFANYMHHQDSPHSWMLGRFVVGADKLSALASLVAERNGSMRPMSLAVVMRAGEVAAEFGDRFAEDLQRLREVQSTTTSMPSADAIEVKVPNADPLEWLQGFQLTAIPAASWLQANLFFEVGFAGDWERRMRRLRAEASEAFGRRTGFKLRCGGLNPAAIPSSLQIAEFMAACKSMGGDWKATAGLHHPLPTDDPSLGATMHGFVNLFTAALVHQFDKGDERLERMTKVLEDRDSDSWTFTDEAMSWRDFSVKTSSISTARKHLAVSFGSCSFDEPTEDLAALGWL
jgi:hypothetical protein